MHIDAREFPKFPRQVDDTFVCVCFGWCALQFRCGKVDGGGAGGGVGWSMFWWVGAVSVGGMAVLTSEDVEAT